MHNSIAPGEFVSTLCDFLDICILHVHGNTSEAISVFFLSHRNVHKTGSVANETDTANILNNLAALFSSGLN